MTIDCSSQSTVHANNRSIKSILHSVEYANKSFIKTELVGHSITFSSNATTEDMKFLLAHHLSSGNCFALAAEACTGIVLTLLPDSDDKVLVSNQAAFQILIMTSLIKLQSLRIFRRIFDVHNIYYDTQFTLSMFRSELRKFITKLRKGKSKEDKREAIIEAENEVAQDRQDLHETWPRIVPKTLKDKLAQIFQQETSSATLSTFTCAVCLSESYNSSKQKLLLLELDLELLKKPQCIGNLPFPYTQIDCRLKDALLDSHGISTDENGDLLIVLCKTCHGALKRNKLPPLSLANGTYLGPVPSALQDLTPIEETMIVQCRSKCWIIQLKEENPLISTPDTQRGIRGHIIIYPQQTSDIIQLLPPSVEDIITPICVLFVGSSPPTTDWLRDKAKPLCVRREKVRSALLWLKENNYLYADVTINHDVLNSLEDEQILPFHIEHIIPSDATETVTDRYDRQNEPDEISSEFESGTNSIPFQNIVITDIDGHSPSHELRAAALCHIKHGSGYLQIPHDPKPVNEFFNPKLFPMIYPTLFPYGIGGFEDRSRRTPISMKRHVKHLCGMSDRRFQEHYSFLFTAFNILQRRSILLHTSLKVCKANFNSAAASFSSVSPKTVHIVTERISRGDSVTANNQEERKVLDLMNQVNTVIGNVPASSASRVVMCNEIKALMIEKGMPSFFITINPADVYNPLVKFLSGADIDIDALLPEQVPKYREQSILVAKNPFVAAKFFNIYMKAFVSSLLAYDSKQHNLEGGILGVVNGYYGCVEAQGRGTLHCHMMI